MENYIFFQSLTVEEHLNKLKLTDPIEEQENRFHPDENRFLPETAATSETGNILGDFDINCVRLNASQPDVLSGNLQKCIF